MDQVKIGKFIAALRKQSGLTQEALGEKLGVSNKTISRWENGNYMPNIEMLRLLSKEFDVSINELLSGEKIPDEEFRKKADENVIKALKQDVFSFAERKEYFKKKWRIDHLPLLTALAAAPFIMVILGSLMNKAWLICLAPIAALLGYAWQNNTMMIYVEHHLYDDPPFDGKYN